MTGVAFAVVVAASFSGCAPKSRVARACEPVPAAFYVPGQDVYPDCAVDRRVRLTQGARPFTYTPSIAQSCARAVIEVVVDSAGRPRPETARVVKTTDPVFATAVINGLETARFEPALKAGRPVAQLHRHEVVMSLVNVVVATGTSPRSARLPRSPKC